jgi:S1/P1 nuclease
MKTTLKPLAVFAAASQIACPTYAFDWTGHIIIQEIALSRLNHAAKQNVDALVAELQKTPDNGAYDPISISCWLDDIRNYRTPDFHTWHYIDFGLNGEGPSISTDVGDLNNQDGNVVIGLKRAVAVLKGGSDPVIQNKPVALALVCHLVGDIHQPMHCVAHYFPNGHTEGELKSPHDEGGNLVELKNAKLVWPNLHFFWDSAYRAIFLQASNQVDLEGDKIDTPIHLGGDPNKRIVKHDYQNVTGRVNEIEAIDIGQVGTDVNFQAWANESHQIAEKAAYGKLTFDDKFHLSTSVSADYVFAARQIAQRRLKLAGCRLALVLNDIWK